MKDEIKEILDRLDYNEWEVDLYKVPIQWSELYDIRDYITNLQEENEKLKELCDKYEEEHSTTFNEWKETITDKYQTLKELQQKTDNQKEEIDRLVKQREKFMKKYGYLKEEKDKYKNVIDKIKQEIEIFNSVEYNANNFTILSLITGINELLEEVE